MSDTTEDKLNEILSYLHNSSNTELINQLGSDIDCENAGDESGWSVAMNGDGTRVIVGRSIMTA